MLSDTMVGFTYIKLTTLLQQHRDQFGESVFYPLRKEKKVKGQDHPEVIAAGEVSLAVSGFLEEQLRF